MKAMVLKNIRQPLEALDIKKPIPQQGQLLLKIHACGICRTDLHVVDGELTEPKLPLVPGHQIVGIVEDASQIKGRYKRGDRIGVRRIGAGRAECFFVDQ